jgi:hypothetical protein
MGTSTPFGGGNAKDPLIPSWLSSGDAVPPAGVPVANGQGSADSETDSAGAGQTGHAIASQFANRFRVPRTQINKYFRSGGTDRKKLGAAISSYVSHAAGGSKVAARRMASDKRAGGRLAGLLYEAGDTGIREVLRSLNLDALENRSISEIYASLVDVICAPGGDLDDAFAREAYLEAVAEVIEMNIDDMEKPSPETISLILERFIANSIYTRILNAISNQLVTLPDSMATVKTIEKQLREFVRGAVSDAIDEVGRVLNASQMKAVMDGLYERSLAILQVYSDNLAEGTV